MLVLCYYWYSCYFVDSRIGLIDMACTVLCTIMCTMMCTIMCTIVYTIMCTILLTRLCTTMWTAVCTIVCTIMCTVMRTILLYPGYSCSPLLYGWFKNRHQGLSPESQRWRHQGSICCWRSSGRVRHIADILLDTALLCLYIYL